LSDLLLLRGTLRAGTTPPELSPPSSTEGFLSKHLPLRDGLAWRAAKGESLTALERGMLEVIDQLLDERDRGPERLPAQVAEIVRAVRDTETGRRR
jgi:hypothetical protein